MLRIYASGSSSSRFGCLLVMFAYGVESSGLRGELLDYNLPGL